MPNASLLRNVFSKGTSNIAVGICDAYAKCTLACNFFSYSCAHAAVSQKVSRIPLQCQWALLQKIRFPAENKHPRGVQQSCTFHSELLASDTLGCVAMPTNDVLADRARGSHASDIGRVHHLRSRFGRYRVHSAMFSSEWPRGAQAPITAPSLAAHICQFVAALQHQLGRNQALHGLRVVMSRFPKHLIP